MFLFMFAVPVALLSYSLFDGCNKICHLNFPSFYLREEDNRDSRNITSDRAIYNGLQIQTRILPYKGIVSREFVF